VARDPRSAGLDRREAVRLLLGGGLAAALPVGPGCGGGADDPEAYTAEDAARLARQQAEEAARAGGGRFGPLVFRGYRGLAELPWFEVGADGRLRTVAELPGIVDIHAHFGMDFYLGIDPTRRSERVEHLLDCDATDPGCRLDLDVYVNANFTEEAHAALPRKFATGAFDLGPSRTHTAANLLAEMDDVGVERAAILPIEIALPFAASLTERWGRAIRANGWQDRLLPFASVDPHADDAPDRLRAHADAGARGVKVHPEMQRVYPDAPEAMALYEVCRERRLPVVFHAGRSGIEPEGIRKFALMRHYEAPAAEFPDVHFVFGHGGARDLERAIPIARAHRNVWLGLSSLGVSQIDRALSALGPERLVFGSDWPFYHLAVTLAKILIVTRGDAGVRDALLRGNAEAVLA
jgi:predicted TIM-barrel fold metal-dependent hydrolase